MAWRTGIAHAAIALPGYARSPGGSAVFHFSIIDLLPINVLLIRINNRRHNCQLTTGCGSQFTSSSSVVIMYVNCRCRMSGGPML
jgi:hypothetical protein